MVIGFCQYALAVGMCGIDSVICGAHNICRDHWDHEVKQTSHGLYGKGIVCFLGIQNIWSNTAVTLFFIECHYRHIFQEDEEDYQGIIIHNSILRESYPYEGNS